MVLTMSEPRPTPPPSAAPGEGGTRELRCKKRVCRTLVARLVGASLRCLDGTSVGPVARGMVVARRCPRCGCNNVFWL